MDPAFKSAGLCFSAFWFLLSGSAKSSILNPIVSASIP